ncbi:MAG: L-gulonate 5-dehydrogenase [Thermoleophilaceae bacterium]|nr:L-gulonate 5-dehydrogenase [Thermoleophilaceae bacterium]
MRAVVTRGQGVMELADLPEPGEPGPGEVLVRPQAVGICGSDFHFLLGELGDGSEFPRIQGHEVGATVESVGSDCRRGLRSGDSVALHPLSYCGKCYPCRIGRTNVCDNFSLIGIHEDGGFQELLRMPEQLVFPTSERRPAVAALAEPLSIAVHAITRSRLEAGEHVVIFGAGPIGQAICLLAREREAPVLMIDPQLSRLEIGAGFGAETMPWTDDVVERAREWSGGEGAEVVFDATGAPEAIRAGFEAAVSAGRLVMVGMSHHDVPLRVFGFVDKELDVLGVSCAKEEEFGDAVAFVERNGDRLENLITQQFPLERASEALRWAMDHPSEAMKVVIGDIN